MKSLVAYVIAASLAATSMCSAGTYICKDDDGSEHVDFNNNYMRDQFDSLGLDYTKSTTFWLRNGNHPDVIFGRSIKEVQVLQFCEDSNGEEVIIREVIHHKIAFRNAARIRIRWNDTCRLQMEVKWSKHGDFHRVHDAYDGKKAGIEVWLGSKGKFGYDDLSGCH
ncbi:hypothetical protein [Pseudoruegeria sp. HB172150]|uniref:hypothetical protein n=1 Tax=Pseudoruegeria sp. HB172150 TaxID=2721164 RepID=UPI0015550D04|nr:hypothetical protein [Pseudoruegeria sp. HB172150]